MKPASLRHALLTISLVLLLPFSGAKSYAESPSSANVAHSALKDVTILIIRHAEKPESGFELSPAGQKRAEAYASYFKRFTADGQSLKPDYLVATADSKNSHRPRLTLEPLSHSLGLKIDDRVKNKNFQDLVNDLESHNHGHHILICWHHGEIPNLIESLGANPAKLLPEGKWPTEEFSWVLLLRFDHEGRLISEQTRCIHEKLMPTDN